MFPSRRIFAIVSIAAANTVLWSCVSRTAGALSSTETPPSEVSLAKKESQLARTLIVIGRSVATTEERGWLARVDASLGHTRVARADQLESRMRTMLAADFTREERLLILSQGQVSLAFELISAGRLQEAQEAARFVLAKENLSAQIQRWALSGWMIAHTLSLRSPPTDFHALQRMHCDELCELPGWRLVSEEDGGTLSRTGYDNRLLASLQFELAGKKRPPWLATLIETDKVLAAAWNAGEPGNAISEPNRRPTPTAPEAVLAQMWELLEKRKWDEASKLGETHLRTRSLGEAKSKKPSAALPGATCDAIEILTWHAKANNARFGQRREAFLSYQESFLGALEQGDCRPENLGLNEEDHRAFVIEAELWLARLLWERGRLVEANKWAERAALASQAAAQWPLFLESAQVLVGRVGYETQTPTKALAELEKLIALFRGPSDEEFQAWAALRKGLLAFLAKDFPLAVATFDSLLTLETDGASRSRAWYWRGRSQAAQGLASAAAVSFQRAGREDPLSYYDALSGQMLSSPSGLASTSEKTPFEDPWREVQERWVRMRVGKPFALFRPELWFGDDAPPASPEGDSTPEDVVRRQRQAFENSVSSSLLLATALRAGLGNETFEKFSSHLRDSGSLFSRLLRSEALWAKQSYTTFYGAGQSHFPSAVRIAWLLHAMGDYRSAIAFVALFKNEILKENEDLAFLSFIFYPKPYAAQFAEAAQQCGVDVDLLFAVARQESLFQPRAVSPVGAVGLMQLLPTTAGRVLGAKGRQDSVSTNDLFDTRLNTLAGACYLRALLERYNGSLPLAVAAYNAGEDTVDTWLARRDKLPDSPYFTEWIPYQETRDYVQKVLRNYWNMKWIYGTKNAQ